MDKRYQVFVSSTYEDLQDERKTVIQLLLENDCIPSGMELFPASNEEQWSLIKSVIDDCDYYLLIVGGRYGSTNKNGISYTQMEYEYAFSIGKPIIAFVHKNPDSLPKSRTEKSIKGQKALAKFKSEIQGFQVKFWESKEDLAASVVTSVHKLIKRFPAQGWVKADAMLDVPSLKEVLKLQSENKQLKEKLEHLNVNQYENEWELEQGNDIVELSYTLPTSNHEQVLNTISFTWDQVFASFAPRLLSGGTDYVIRDAIEEMISYELKLDNDPYNFKSKIHITETCLGAIELQFKALGLIYTVMEGGDSFFTGSIVWQLSERGEAKLISLVAKKR